MLKNELKSLAHDVAQINQRDNYAYGKSRTDFSKMVSENCGKARDAWAAAAFSPVSDNTLCRYYNFHYYCLSSLITEVNWEQGSQPLIDLCGLMDHLLSVYKRFIDQQQPISSKYAAYRLAILRPQYHQFIAKLQKSSVSNPLKQCIELSLAPVYNDLQVENLNLGAMFYRTDLLDSLAGVKNTAGFSDEGLIYNLIGFNFNHYQFFKFLRQNVIAELDVLPKESHPRLIMELTAAIPVIHESDVRCFDMNWPHIAELYKDWIVDYGALLNLYHSKQVDSLVEKVPLTISVKNLACMIRALYEAGFYGTISLTAIFDHAAMVFTTKRQKYISAESLSNSYYQIEQSSAIKMARMFTSAADYLKSCYSLA